MAFYCLLVHALMIKNAYALLLLLTNLNSMHSKCILMHESTQTTQQ